MKICRTVAELHGCLNDIRSRGPVGLVPTMGNLHEGHLQLVRQCTADNAVNVVSIFVNPLQFGPNEDFASYPRTLDADVALIGELAVDIVFAPSDREIYPRGREGATRVSVPGISSVLCGAHRPGHFDGVTTVVLKLFNLVRPTRAYFGEKDFQQLALIRRMVADLDVGVDVRGVATVRAPDGLALSSRNQYLTPAERRVAPTIAAALNDIAKALAGGERDYAALESAARTRLDQAGFETDYVAIRHPSTLAASEPGDDDFVVLAAARLGRARLIDNVRASVEGAA